MDRVKTFYACTTVLEPVREYLNNEIGPARIRITNGLRTKELFKALKQAGYDPSETSDHFWDQLTKLNTLPLPLKWAADCIVEVWDPVKNKWVYSKVATRKAFTYIKDYLRHSYGQLIFYRKAGHFHFSLPTPTNHGETFVKGWDGTLEVIGHG